MNDDHRAGSSDCHVIEFDAMHPSPSETVVDAVTDVESSTSAELDERLYDVVDPDALDSLVTGSSSVERVEFSFCGHDLIVDRDGVVVR